MQRAFFVCGVIFITRL